MNGCTSLPGSGTAAPRTAPSAPVIGTITQPTCIVSTGSIILNGLPSAGIWTLTQTPGAITISGTGTSYTLSVLPAGTYSYTVTNSAGCTSPSSVNAVISAQPATPSAPSPGTLTVPTCTLSTGSVVLNGLPSSGTWTLTRYPGTVVRTGTGTSTTDSGLPSGTYNYTIASSAGCISVLSSNVVIPLQPATPSAPSIGTITQPTCNLATGSVVINGLPSTGLWTLTRLPGSIATSGNGTTSTITGLSSATYTFTVTNADGCTSLSSGNAIINAQPPTPSAPVTGTITQPICTLATGGVVLSGLPSTGLWTITRTPGAVLTTGLGTTTSITELAEGSYTFTVTNSVGCISASSASVVINSQPASPSSPLQSLDCSLGFGHAVLTMTNPLGTGITYSLDGGSYQSGTLFSEVQNGSHTISVKNSFGCITTGSVFSVSCGCINGPSVSLSSLGGSTCGVSPATISGNTFGGSATNVTITHNGAGTLSPSSANTSPFSFTYTPHASDAGKSVIITVTTNNPLGSPCASAVATYTLKVNANPAIPSVGAITQPTCAVPTGTVILSGLPASGQWIITRTPGAVIQAGSGSSANVDSLDPGTYKFFVTNDLGCSSGTSGNVVINIQPGQFPSPVVGTIIQPTCLVSTGSVTLTDLPAAVTWTLTRNPGAVSITGTGTTKTVTGLDAGTYNFTVNAPTGCISQPSSNVVLNPQLATPAPPTIGTITQPTCTLSTGSVLLNGLPGTGTWTLIRYPGTVTSTGTGVSTTISGLTAGSYNFTVTSAEGCSSSASSNVVITTQPVTPGVPVIGTITQPTCSNISGAVVLNGLPASGNWTLTRLPDGTTLSGTGTSAIISGLPIGTYNFKVTNTAGCTSALTGIVSIVANTSAPTLIITNPAPVCFPSTADITASGITAGSSSGLIFTYWNNANATVAFSTPANATEGTYYIKGTVALTGCSDIKPVTVIVRQKPFANAGPDKVLDNLFNTVMEANTPGINEKGVWSLISGSGRFSDSTFARTTVNNLSLGKNIFVWTITNGVCLPSIDSVIITVNDLVIPTLITPNMDGRNDYFIINGKETLGKIQLVIFDRTGHRVYKSDDYNNDWNGVDEKGNPLPDDTYFFIMKTQSGKSFSKYIVVRR